MSLSHSPKIVTTGLVQMLDAANIKSYPGSGTQWNDLSGNSNGATLMNGAAYLNENGGLINLVGPPRYVLTNLYLPTSEFSITLPYKNATGSGWCPLWACEVWDSSLGYLAYFTGPTQLNFTRGGGSGLQVTANAVQYAIYTFTVDSNAQAAIYINDALVGSFTMPLASVTKPLILGSRYANTGDGVTDTTVCKIPAVQVYNRVLNLAEVRQNFNALRGRYGI